MSYPAHALLLPALFAIYLSLCSSVNFAYNSLSFVVCCYSLCMCFISAFEAVIKEDGTSLASAPWGSDSF